MKTYVKIYRFKDSDRFQIIIRLLGTWLLVASKGGESNWFKIFDRGVSWKKKSKKLSFSERSGQTKYLEIFGYIFTYIK